jgi:hypothetical protein
MVLPSCRESGALAITLHHLMQQASARARSRVAYRTYMNLTSRHCCNYVIRD